ncbi:MFS transporter [Rhizobium multihospitium]|uniref:Predicted arabinose efflux permease, MFS family n=1 Tax=Rhizobium multihospitium TaxID=410764 RepID=A0A1C3WZZ3_9HYPH|nr:MFS transporter [Rhizobium multihospitium]SCB45607.1 Predicted arabinose efflux permease, MFS family [Rhizobium multihospitium]
MPPLRHRYRDPIALSAPIGGMPFRSPTARAVAALSLTQLIGWGSTFYLPAVIGPAIARELGVGLPTVMAGPTIMLVVMAMVSWPLSSIFERHGTRPIMAFGSAMGAIGLLLMSLANGPVSYVLSWIILGLAGACMLTTPAQIAVSEVACEKTHQALGVLILAGGLTSTIVWPTTGLLQAQWGWRMTSLTYAALMLLVCLPLHWIALARHPRERSIVTATAEPSPIDRPSFTLLALSFAANGFVTWGFALTIIILFEAAGLDHASALAAAAFIGVAQWAGRMVDFLGGRRWSGFVTGLAAAALFPLSFIVLLLTSNFAGAMLFTTLYGMASGITAVTRATLPLQIFPAGTYARASARLGVPLNLSFAAAPPVFTAIMTSAGPHAALWLALAISIFAFFALLGLFLLHRRMRHALR